MSCDCHVTCCYGHLLTCCRKLADLDSWSQVAVHVAADMSIIMDEMSESVSPARKVSFGGLIR